MPISTLNADFDLDGDDFGLDGADFVVGPKSSHILTEISLSARKLLFKLSPAPRVHSQGVGCFFSDSIFCSSFVHAKPHLKNLRSLSSKIHLPRIVRLFLVVSSRKVVKIVDLGVENLGWHGF